MKKTTIAIILNILFGGVGYLYIKELTRLPLGIFLIYVTVYDFIHPAVNNTFVISNPAISNDPFAIHIPPMLSLFGSIPGILILTIMALDIYFLVKRQNKKSEHTTLRVDKNPT